MDTVDPICTCGFEPDITLYYLLHCNLYSTKRLELLNNVSFLNPSLRNCSNEKPLNILLHGSQDFNYNINKEILKAKVSKKISEHFDGPFLKNVFPNVTYVSYIL